MDTLRDEYFSRQDADEWDRWNQLLEEKDIDAYLTALCSYYGNLEEAA